MRASRIRRARCPGLSDTSNCSRTSGASVSCANRVVLCSLSECWPLQLTDTNPGTAAATPAGRRSHGRTAAAKWSRGALIGRAQRRGVLRRRCPAAVLNPPPPESRAKRLDLLVQKIAQQNALALQVVVQIVAEPRMFVVRLGRLGPHLGQQDLQRRCDIAEPRSSKQIVGDDFGQPVFDRQPVTLAKPLGSSRSQHDLDNAAAVQSFEKHLGSRQFVLDQVRFQFGQPLLAEAEHQFALGPADSDRCKRGLHHFQQVGPTRRAMSAIGRV